MGTSVGWLWMALGLAWADPPADLNLDETRMWEDRADDLLNGPPGCWDVVGRASWNHFLTRFEQTRGDVVFVGRLDDGIWQSWHIEPVGEVVQNKDAPPVRTYEVNERRFSPVIGKVRPTRSVSINERNGMEVEEPDRETEPVNVLREMLDELRGEVSTSYARWNDPNEGVVLVRDIPMGDGARAPEAQMMTLFPGGGTLSTAYDVAFPESFSMGTFPAVARIRDGEVHLRGKVVGDRVFPISEAFEGELRAYGFRLRFRQTMVYRSFSPCSAGTAAERAEEHAQEETVDTRGER